MRAFFMSGLLGKTKLVEAGLIMEMDLKPFF
jgi:hypothetical protein